MKLPRDVNGAEAARVLQRLGYSVRRQTGSHLILRRAARTVVIPQHIGRLRSVMSVMARRMPPSMFRRVMVRY
jgi:predicted RNA binding protein YcfA (HicA-like mRNA interferase family)